MILTRVTGFLKKAPFVAIIFSGSTVISLYIHNIGELTRGRLFIPLFSVLIISCFFSLAIRKLFKNNKQADIYSSLFIIFFFLYGQAVTFLNSKSYPIINKIGAENMILAVWTVSFIVLFQILKKIHTYLDGFYKFILAVSIFIILIQISDIVLYTVKTNLHPPAKSPQKLPKLKKATTTPAGYLPDVYYIIPDSYASPSNYSKFFSYNDDAFVSYLKNKGFYVASDSTSNYPTTLLSVSSTLNMEYLNYLSVFTNSSDQSVAQPLIENNNVITVFRMLGYKFYQMGSWWAPTQVNKNAKDNYAIQKRNRIGIDGFTYTLLKASMLGPFLDHILPGRIIGESNEDKRTIILYQFDTIPAISKLRGPKFVFIHIISPHPPYVFDKNCSFLPEQEAEVRPVERNFAEQTNCMNNKLETAIDTIMKVSPHPPVILLQADEGAKLVAEKLIPIDSWMHATQIQLKMKFPILAAYLMPGVSTDTLYPSVTPVNAFKIILNAYFGTQFGLLPDKNYIYLDDTHLYDFRDVTTKVKN